MTSSISQNSDTRTVPGSSGIISDRILSGERALFQARELVIDRCIFENGESPLKEGRNLRLNQVSFKWKYPLWYCRNITVSDSAFFEMGRAGIWYTDDITMTDCLYEAPKGFRKVRRGRIANVRFPNAQETLWNCEDMELENVTARGDYFAMNLSRARISGLDLVGNYGFDGASDQGCLLEFRKHHHQELLYFRRILCMEFPEHHSCRLHRGQSSGTLLYRRAHPQKLPASRDLSGV